MKKTKKRPGTKLFVVQANVYGWMLYVVEADTADAAKELVKNNVSFVNHIGDVTPIEPVGEDAILFELWIDE